MSRGAVFVCPRCHWPCAASLPFRSPSAFAPLLSFAASWRSWGLVGRAALGASLRARWRLSCALGSLFARLVCAVGASSPASSLLGRPLAALWPRRFAGALLASLPPLCPLGWAAPCSSRWSSSGLPSSLPSFPSVAPRVGVSCLPWVCAFVRLRRLGLFCLPWVCCLCGSAASRSVLCVVFQRRR